MAEEYDREVLMRRGDIKRIINMDNRIFERWYDERSCATKVLLEYYRTIGSIPSLLNPGIERNMVGNYKGTIESLERGLEYLEVIKNLRE